MIYIAVVLLFLLAYAAMAVGGHLIRIADAIEAQNRHYGVGAPADEKEEA